MHKETCQDAQLVAEQCFSDNDFNTAKMLWHYRNIFKEVGMTMIKHITKLYKIKCAKDAQINTSREFLLCGVN